MSTLVSTISVFDCWNKKSYWSSEWKIIFITDGTILLAKITGFWLRCPKKSLRSLSNLCCKATFVCFYVCPSSFLAFLSIFFLASPKRYPSLIFKVKTSLVRRTVCLLTKNFSFFRPIFSWNGRKRIHSKGWKRPFFTFLLTKNVRREASWCPVLSLKSFVVKLK